jgi:hypothetical protein
VSSPWPRHEPWKSFTPYRRPHCFLAVVLLPQERKWLTGRTQLYTTCVLLFFFWQECWTQDLMRLLRCSASWPTLSGFFF